MRKKEKKNCLNHLFIRKPAFFKKKKKISQKKTLVLRIKNNALKFSELLKTLIMFPKKKNIKI